MQRRVNCIFMHSLWCGFDVERDSTVETSISVTFLQLQWNNQFWIKGWSPTARETRGGHFHFFCSSCQPLLERMPQEPQSISLRAASGSFCTPEPFHNDEHQVWSAMSASSRKHSSSLHYCCSWRSHDLWVRNWWFPAELKLKCSFDALFLVWCSFWLFDGSLVLLFDACVSLILFHDHICF